MTYDIERLLIELNLSTGGRMCLEERFGWALCLFRALIL